jgi:transposase-like protein
MQDTSRIRKHRTPAQREKILQSYRRTQLTQKDFAAQAGVSVSTLAGWLRRADDLGREASSFVPVPNLLAATPAAPAYRLQWPGGLSLEIRSGFPPGELAALLQLLQAP